MHCALMCSISACPADLDRHKVLFHCGKCKFPVSVARRSLNVELTAEMFTRPL